MAAAFDDRANCRFLPPVIGFYRLSRRSSQIRGRRLPAPVISGNWIPDMQGVAARRPTECPFRGMDICLFFVSVLACSELPFSAVTKVQTTSTVEGRQLAPAGYHGRREKGNKWVVLYLIGPPAQWSPSKSYVFPCVSWHRLRSRSLPLPIFPTFPVLTNRVLP